MVPSRQLPEKEALNQWREELPVAVVYLAIQKGKEDIKGAAAFVL